MCTWHMDRTLWSIHSYSTIINHFGIIQRTRHYRSATCSHRYGHRRALVIPRIFPVKVRSKTSYSPYGRQMKEILQGILLTVTCTTHVRGAARARDVFTKRSVIPTKPASSVV